MWVADGYFAEQCRVQRNSGSTFVQMDDLAKLLSYKMNQMANQSNQKEVKRNTLQRTLTPQEVKLYSQTAKTDPYD